MKRKTTKELLADSFLELASTRTINRISVLQIVENCGMTKPTFYRYFKDKYDLIAWLYVREAQKNIDRIGTDGYLWRDTLLDGLRYYEANRSFMVNALKHTNGRESFINLINEADIQFIQHEVKKKLRVDTVPDSLSVIIKIYCYGTGQFLCDWLLDPKPMPCEKLARAMEASIPEPLKPFLCE